MLIRTICSHEHCSTMYLFNLLPQSVGDVALLAVFRRHRSDFAREQLDLLPHRPDGVFHLHGSSVVRH